MSYQDTKSFEQELNDCRDASIELLKYCTELRELNAELSRKNENQRAFIMRLRELNSELLREAKWEGMTHEEFHEWAQSRARHIIELK